MQIAAVVSTRASSTTFHHGCSPSRRLRARSRLAAYCNALNASRAPSRRERCRLCRWTSSCSISTSTLRSPPTIFRAWRSKAKKSRRIRTIVRWRSSAEAERDARAHDAGRRATAMIRASMLAESERRLAGFLAKRRRVRPELAPARADLAAGPPGRGQGRILIMGASCPPYTLLVPPYADAADRWRMLAPEADAAKIEDHLDVYALGALYYDALRRSLSRAARQHRSELFVSKTPARASRCWRSARTSSRSCRTRSAERSSDRASSRSPSAWRCARRKTPPSHAEVAASFALERAGRVARRGRSERRCAAALQRCPPACDRSKSACVRRTTSGASTSAHQLPNELDDPADLLAGHQRTERSRRWPSEIAL